jgi:hypothetical protein
MSIPKKNKQSFKEHDWTKKDVEMDFDEASLRAAVKKKSHFGLKGNNVTKLNDSKQKNNKIQYLNSASPPAPSAALSKKFDFSKNAVERLANDKASKKLALEQAQRSKQQQTNNKNKVTSSRWPLEKPQLPLEKQGYSHHQQQQQQRLMKGPSSSSSSSSLIERNNGSKIVSSHAMSKSSRTPRSEIQHHTNHTNNSQSASRIIPPRSNAVRLSSSSSSSVIMYPTTRRTSSSSSSLTSASSASSSSKTYGGQRQRQQLLKGGTNLNNALTIDSSSDEEEEDTFLSNSAHIFFGLHNVGKCSVTWPGLNGQLNKKQKKKKEDEGITTTVVSIVIELNHNKNKYRIEVDEIESIIFRDKITLNAYGVQEGVSAAYVKTDRKKEFHKRMMNMMDSIDDFSEEVDGLLIVFESSKGTPIKEINELFVKLQQQQQHAPPPSSSSSSSNKSGSTTSSGGASAFEVKFDQQHSNAFFTTALHQINDSKCFADYASSTSSPRKSLRS